jgi:hypothetical protein
MPIPQVHPGPVDEVIPGGAAEKMRRIERIGEVRDGGR